MASLLSQQTTDFRLHNTGGKDVLTKRKRQCSTSALLDFRPSALLDFQTKTGFRRPLELAQLSPGASKGPQKHVFSPFASTRVILKGANMLLSAYSLSDPSQIIVFPCQ